MPHIIFSQDLLLDVDDTRILNALMSCYLVKYPETDPSVLALRLQASLDDLQSAFRCFHLGFLSQQSLLDAMQNAVPELDIQQIIGSFNARIVVSEQSFQKKAAELIRQTKQNGYRFHLYVDSNSVYEKHIEEKLCQRNINTERLKPVYSFKTGLRSAGLIHKILSEIPQEELADTTLVLGIPSETNIFPRFQQAAEQEIKIIIEQVSAQYPAVTIKGWDSKIQSNMALALDLPTTDITPAVAAASIAPSIPTLIWSFSQYVTKTHLLTLAEAAVVGAVTAYRRYGQK